MSEKGGNGFPYLVFMDADGEVILQYNGEWEPAAIQKTGIAVGRYLALRNKGDAASTADRVALFQAKLELDLLRFDEANKEIVALVGLAGFHELVTNDELFAMNQKMVNLEFMDFFGELKEMGNQREVFAKAGKKILAMREAKRVPVGYAGMNFWNLLMYYAEQEEDLALLQDAAENFKTMLDPEKRLELQEIRKIDARVEKAKDW